MTEDKLLNYADGQLLYNDLRERIDNKQTTPRGGKKGQVLKKKSNKNYDVGWADETGGVQDIQVDETSIVENGVADLDSAEIAFYGLADAAGDTRDHSNYNVGYYYDDTKASIRSMIDAVGKTDYATSSAPGLVKPGYGLEMYSNGEFGVRASSAASIKEGISQSNFLTPSQISAIAFYGLAKAAGASQSQSSNPIGTYTDTAKKYIQTMLGIDPEVIASYVEIPIVENISGTDVTINCEPNVRYVCGEVSSISITPPSSGSTDVIFKSGSTATALTLPANVKMPQWFNAASLETNTIYEILITDGVYGSVMTWPV